MTYLLIGTTLLIALLLVIRNRVNMTLVSGLMVLAILGDFIFTGEDVYSFLGLFTIISNSWVIILLVCVCLLSASSAIVLSLFSAAGLLVLFCGDSLATVLGIESLTLLLLVMLFHNRGYFSAESSLKYLLVSVLGGALIVLGVIISFTVLGRFDLGIAYNLSMLLLLVGVFLKLAGGGFHFWLMDVIEGAGSYASSIFMTLGKIPSFYLLGAVLSSVSGVANSAMALGAVVSLVISGLGTILSTKLSRVLAYSAIGSTGWFLVLVLVQSINLSLLYVAFTLTIVPLFIFLGALNDVYMIGLRGQRFANSLIIIFLVMCFSGFPPFIGFQVKWQLLMVVVTSSWLFPLIGLGILSTTFGYFRWLFLSVTYIRVYRPGMTTLYISVSMLIGIMCLSVAFFSILLLINTGFGLVLLCVVSLRGYTFKAKFEPLVVCTQDGLRHELGFTIKGNPGRISLRLFGSLNRWVSLRYLSSGYLAERLVELGISNIHIDDNRFWVDERLSIDEVKNFKRYHFCGWRMETRGPQLDHFNGRLLYGLDRIGSDMKSISSEDLFRDDIASNLDGIRRSGHIRVVGNIWGVADGLGDDEDSE